MPFSSPSTLLDELLEGAVLSPTDLDAVVSSFADEGQFHDFKDGKLLGARKPGSVVREYVSAFANAEGGVLVVGVSERDGSGKRQVTGCKALGKPLDAWAKDCVVGFAGALTPPPRFQTVPHPKGEVLVCAVARAPSLLFCNVEGRAVYYLRIHDSNVPCPDYLISDLLLGRRNHPTVALSVPGVLAQGGIELEGHVKAVSLNFEFAIENLSLARAPAVRLGVVSFGLRNYATSKFLERYIENKEGKLGSDFKWHLSNRTSIPPRDVPPLTVENVRVEDALVVPDLPADTSLNPICLAAVYVLPDGSPPTWFQLRCATGRIAKDVGFADPRGGVTTEPASRPEVNWTRFGVF